MNFLDSHAPFLRDHWKSLGLVGLGFVLGWACHEKKRPPKSQHSRNSIDKSNRDDGDPEDNLAFQDTLGGYVNSHVDLSTTSEANFLDAAHVPYVGKPYPTDVMLHRATVFYRQMDARRSVRFFSAEDVPRSVVELLVHTAGTSPSGAHTEPWTFVCIRDAATKRAVRMVVEEEERINYQKRMGEKWVSDLRSIGTTWQKSYLQDAPWLLLVFRQTYGVAADGSKRTHYYSEISISISVGILLSAIQNVGLVTLTSTPLNAGPKLRELAQRPPNEKLVLLLPIGYASEDATVPALKRKSLNDIMKII